jgi:uncharacterized protein YceK
MKNLLIRWLAGAALLLSGCSSSTLYASGQAWQQQACNKLQDRTERERCMASTQLSYPDYQRQKEAASTAP